MDFTRAKLCVNSDPEWWPDSNSPEYFEILKIMKMSGTVTLVDKLLAQKNHNPPPAMIVNPLNAPQAEVKVKKISKEEFLKIPSIRKKVEEHMALNKK